MGTEKVRDRLVKETGGAGDALPEEDALMRGGHNLFRGCGAENADAFFFHSSCYMEHPGIIADKYMRKFYQGSRLSDCCFPYGGYQAGGVSSLEEVRDRSPGNSIAQDNDFCTAGQKNSFYKLEVIFFRSGARFRKRPVMLGGFIITVSHDYRRDGNSQVTVSDAVLFEK